MKIKVFGRTILLGKDLSDYSQYIGLAENSYAFLQQKYGVDYSKRDKLKAYRNLVYDCVSLIAEQCGDYKPLVQRRNGDQWENVEHEFLQLLRRPGGKDLKAQSFSSFDLWEATISYLLLQGQTYWYMALGKTTSRPREIVLLRADKVGTDVDPETGEINGYFIRREMGEPIPLLVEEVLPFKLFNPEDPYNGKSPVEAASDYIATDESTSEFTKNFFANNGGLSGILSVKGEVSKGAFRKFVRAWREKHEGVKSAGKIAIIRDSDASFEKVGLGLNELDMRNLRDMTIEDVAMAFKVPLVLLGKGEKTGLGRANVETFEYIFAKYNIDKKMDRLDSVMQFALERYYGVDSNQFRVTHENIIPEDKEYILNARDKGVDRWLTRDEIRDEEGLDSIDGGNQLFVGLQQVPINEASVAESSQAAATEALTVTLVKKIKPKQKAGKTERFRLSLMRNQARYEKRFRSKTKPIFLQQRKAVLDNLEAYGGSAKKDISFFDKAGFDRKLAAAVTPVLTDLASVQGGLALAFAGDTENEFLLTAPIEQAIQRGTRKMATNFNTETLERLNKTLAEGVQAGEGLGKLKSRVDDVFDHIEGYRAERIARTETLKSSNTATQWAYRQTGYVTAKQWVVNPDACPQCNEFEGKTVPLDDAFLPIGDSYTYTDEEGEEHTVENSYDTVEVPPLHPNCRCTIIPIRESTSAYDNYVPKEVVEDLKKKHAQQRASDKVYIKQLEENLGLADEPSEQDKTT